MNPTVLLPVSLLASATLEHVQILVAVMFAAAVVCGWAAGALRLPRLIGFIAGGLAAKYAVAFWLKTHGLDWPVALHEAQDMAGGLLPVSDLALGMILFTLGTAFEARCLVSLRDHLWRISLAETSATFLLVSVGTAALAFLVAPGANPIALGLLLGAAAVATAPATTLLVLEEYEAKGPTSDTILTLTGLNCGISIVLFHLLLVVLVAANLVTEEKFAGGALLLDVVLLVLGSAVVGVAVGMLLSWVCSVRPTGETLLLFFGVVFAMLAGEDALRTATGVSFSSLLATLVAGAVFANVAINPQRFESMLRQMGAPLFALFFVIAGYRMHLDMLVNAGLLGAGYVSFRVLGKTLGARFGQRWAHSEGVVNDMLGAALLAQAGVAIGLANFIHAHASDGATTGMPAVFYAVILGSVAIFEIGGPLATKWVAVRSGEVKAIHLIRRHAGAPQSGVAVARVLVMSLVKIVRPRRMSTNHDSLALSVDHIMRTNIKCIQASASFDDVLRFVERSRLSDFPVVDENNELIGVIHFADIRGLTYDPAVSDLITAVDLADVSTPAAARDQTLETLRDTFAAVDVSALPVVDSADTRRVVGVVEQRDLLRALHGGGESGNGH